MATFEPPFSRQQSIENEGETKNKFRWISLKLAYSVDFFLKSLFSKPIKADENQPE